MATYGKVVKVWQQEEDGKKRNQAEEDGAHWRLAASLLVQFASTISTKRGQAHEASSNNVGGAQSDKLSVGAQLDPVRAIRAAQAFRGNG